ncbi:hypothetical protein LQ948_10480 [Jiella sp. MQZ9-1]|uniref:Uncharacterized protein n=1 Tax=Jiella flava TaxID=2816857 RepID=A0A939FYA4_9HYPH|nr:hypothetical protein [Jiella flava]MBO0662410.1 hypothetical protein [Jiella flava]MCD2471634.1 hypothetical protein [Jiella flava]
MYERAVKRLEDPELISALVTALLKAGYDRDTIENALIRQAPVDLDVLADCYERLAAAGAALHEAAGEPPVIRSSRAA